MSNPYELVVEIKESKIYDPVVTLERGGGWVSLWRMWCYQLLWNIIQAIDTLRDNMLEVIRNEYLTDKRTC